MPYAPTTPDALQKVCWLERRNGVRRSARGPNSGENFRSEHDEDNDNDVNHEVLRDVWHRKLPSEHPTPDANRIQILTPPQANRPAPSLLILDVRKYS